MTFERTTLEGFLAPISQALGRTEPPAEVPPAEPQARPRRVTDGLGQKQLIELFAQEAEKIRVGVHRTTAEGAGKTIAGIIEQVGAGAVVCSTQERIGQLGIIEALSACDGAESLTLWDAEAGREANVSACEAARFGITYAWRGIAETGTVVQPCGTDCGRSISLLPLVHIAVVDAESIRATMFDVLHELHEGAGEAGSDLPAQVCMISGPSVTSDIELVRVEGVHGPMYVHYVIVE